LKIKENKSNSNMALVAKNGFKTTYKKQCYTRGELGHKGFECPMRNESKKEIEENHKK
jgi:hypothetical protein